MQSDIDVLLQRAQELIAIPSTADNPVGIGAAYEYMLSLVQASGKSITIEEFKDAKHPSFLAYMGPTRPETFKTILNAHLDVVPGKPEQFQPVIAVTELFGRGAYDMKAAAIILAEVFCEYVDRVPYPLGLQIVTDEETAGDRGTWKQIDAGVRADFIMCGEAGRQEGTYEIANEAKGVAQLRIHFTGKHAHGAYPWKGENATLMAVEFIEKLQRVYPTPGLPTGETTVTVTGITAGTAHNQIPGIATVVLDCRYAPGDPHFASQQSIVNMLNSIDPNVDKAEFHAFALPVQTNPDHPFLHALKEAAEATESHGFTLVRRNGSSDARFYSQVAGHAIEFGIAGGNHHGDNEYVTVAAFANYLQTMRAFFDKTLSIS